jgi:hypothetical protein
VGARAWYSEGSHIRRGWRFGRVLEPAPPSRDDRGMVERGGNRGESRALYRCPEFSSHGPILAHSVSSADLLEHLPRTARGCEKSHCSIMSGRRPTPHSTVRNPRDGRFIATTISARPSLIDD